MKKAMIYGDIGYKSQYNLYELVIIVFFLIFIIFLDFITLWMWITISFPNSRGKLLAFIFIVISSNFCYGYLSFGRLHTRFSYYGIDIYREFILLKRNKIEKRIETEIIEKIIISESHPILKIITRKGKQYKAIIMPDAPKKLHDLLNDLEEYQNIDIIIIKK